MMEQNTMRLMLAILGLVALVITFVGATQGWGPLENLMADVFKSVSNQFYAF